MDIEAKNQLMIAGYIVKRISENRYECWQDQIGFRFQLDTMQLSETHYKLSISLSGIEIIRKSGTGQKFLSKIIRMTTGFRSDLASTIQKKVHLIAQKYEL